MKKKEYREHLARAQAQIERLRENNHDALCQIAFLREAMIRLASAELGTFEIQKQLGLALEATRAKGFVEVMAGTLTEVFSEPFGESPWMTPLNAPEPSIKNGMVAR